MNDYSLLELEKILQAEKTKNLMLLDIDNKNNFTCKEEIK